MSVAGLLSAVRHFGAQHRRLTAVLAIAGLVAVASTSAALTGHAAEERSRAVAAAAAALEQKFVDYYAGALDRLQPLGAQLVDDATAWAASTSPLLTADDVAGLEATAQAVSESLARTAAPEATSAELEQLWNSQWAMIEGARERFGYFVDQAAAAAKAHLDAAPIADSATRQTLVDAIAALTTAQAKHESLTAALTAVTAAAAAVDAAQAAAVAAAEAAAAAAAAAARRGGGGVARRDGEPTCSSDVLTCVNQIRAFYGLGSLSSSLNSTAQDCANRLSGGAFEHTSPLPSGVRGENIARGYGSQASVFNAGMGSAGHRANILRSSFTTMGLGFASGNNWCQQFG